MVARSNPDPSEHRDYLRDVNVCPRRFSILVRIYQADGPVAVRDLAETLVGGAAARKCISEDAVQAEFDRKEIRLHHCDLPSLDDVGLIEYDPKTRLVYPSIEGRKG